MNRTIESTSSKKAPPTAAAEDYRPPYLAAGFAVLAVWALYVVTLAPTTQFWDTSEYIATAHIMGIPHPPGNPLFVVLARAWELLLAPTGLDVAVRINLFSATMGALAHGFWFLIVHRILSFYSSNRTFRLVGAAIAVLVSATAFTVWNQSNVNEKVYTVSLFTIALLSWLAFRWRDTLGKEGKAGNLLVLMAFILALSVGNHLMAFLAAPALFVYILMVHPSTLMNWRLYAGTAVVAVLGLSIHLFLPLRAMLDPVINEADPSTMQALWDSLTRQQYDKPSVLATPWDPDSPRGISLFIAQLGNYLQYFDWQWARSVAGNESFFGGIRPLFTFVFIVLGLFGASTHYRHDRTSWAYVLVLFLTLSFALTFYLNFKYGYSYGAADVGRELREVRERDYFFIVGFSIWGLWAGMGIAALWRRAARWIRAQRPNLPRPYALAAPILAIAFIPLVLNWSWASRADDYTARDWAYNLLMSVEPYSVLFTNGDNDTFPLWYLQEVEGIRQDVTVIVTSYLNTPWYVKQLKQLTTPCPPGRSAQEDPTRIICQRRYEPDEGPSFYATPDSASAVPEKSILPLSDDRIEQIAGTMPFATREARAFRTGNIETTIPENTVLVPSDLFLTSILTTAIGDRPIYFATTTNAYQKLGLQSNLIRQGVAYKLSNGPIEAGEDGIYSLPEDRMTAVTGRYIDLPRTDSLLWNVFVHRSGIPDAWDKWVDASTQGIPFYYGYAHYAAARAHALQEEQEKAEEHAERAEAWIDLGNK